MTYSSHEAFSDAYGDALNEFIDSIDIAARNLVLTNCAGQYRDDVQEILNATAHDNFGKQFIESALAKMLIDEHGKKS